MGEGVSHDGSRVNLPSAGLQDAASGEDVGGSSCGCAGGCPPRDVTPSEASLGECGTEITISIGCDSVPFQLPESSSSSSSSSGGSSSSSSGSTGQSWILSDDKLDHEKFPNTDGISLAVTDDLITFTKGGRLVGVKCAIDKFERDPRLRKERPGYYRAACAFVQLSLFHLEKSFDCGTLNPALQKRVDAMKDECADRGHPIKMALPAR